MITYSHNSSHFCLSVHDRISPSFFPSHVQPRYDFCAPKTGKLDACDFMDCVKDNPWVVKTTYYKSPGDPVVRFTPSLTLSLAPHAQGSSPL